MGCDIHAFLERKIEGEWHLITPIRQDYSSNGGKGTPRGLGAERDYLFFAHLCSVRAGVEASEYPNPKGLPKDVSKVVQWYSDGWESDGHSHSWDTLNDFVDKKLALIKLRNEHDAYSRDWWEYIITTHEVMEDEDRNDYRVVYFFDN